MASQAQKAEAFLALHQGTTPLLLANAWDTGSARLLAARAENYLHGREDLGDTIARLQAYERSGADVLYAPA